MKKGVIKGIAKASIVVLSLFVLAFFSAFYVFPVLAAHVSNATAVTTTTGARNVDTLQLVGLNFSINKTSADANSVYNITNVSIDFGGTGWNLPPNNNSVTCFPIDGGAYRSDVTGNVISCLNTTSAIFNTTGATFNITISTNTTANTPRSPASPQTSTFRINTTDTQGNVNSSTTVIAVTQLNATATVTPVTSTISANLTYTFTVNNTGTDQIDRIIINYTTAGYVDTAAGNVTCPTISTAWTAAVDTDANTITCTNTSSGTLAAGTGATITVRSFFANNTGGVKNFYVDVRGTLNGNFTIVASPPNVTVFGTATATFANSVIANQSVGASGVRVAALNISATGEDLNLTAVRVFLFGNGTSSDVFNVSLHEGATPLASIGGSFSGSPLAVNLSLTSSLNIIAGTSRLVNITFNISTTANAGDTVGVNITGNGSVTLIGNSSAFAVVSGGTPTGLSTQILIFGNITILARNGVVANATPSQANFIAAYVNITAGGESLSLINLSVNTTASNAADLSKLLIFRDTACDNSVSGDNITASRSTVAASEVIGLPGQTVARDATNCYVIAYNISSLAASSIGTRNNFTVSIGSQNVTATGSSSGIALTSTGTALAPSTMAIIYGNLTITGTSRVASTTLIGTNNITVISYNFSATGENITVHEINITVLGSIAVGNITNVALYSGTSDDGIFNDAETFIANISVNNSAVSTYTFKLGSPFQISSGSNNILLVVFNITESSGANNLSGGTTFGANFSANVIRGNSSTILLTPVITTQFSSTSILFGNLSVSGADLTPTVADTGQTDVRIINLTFTATGEAMNISLLNITMINTNNNDVTAAKLYNGSSIGSLIATATRSGSIAAFGTAGGTLYVVPAGSSSSLVVTFDINSSATGGNTVDAMLNTTGIVVNGGSSNVSITIVGTPANPAGTTTINTLSATATVTPTSAAIGNATNYTFTITNGAGASADTIDQIVINYTAAGYVDTEAANITCPTIVAAWTATNDSVLHTATCTKSVTASALAASTAASINISNFKAPSSAGVKQFDVRVRGTNGQGTFDITTSKPSVTVGGTITINGTNKNPTNTVVGTNNVTVIGYNFTASGEAMNISQINVTRTGTATSSDISSVILVQDNGDNVYVSTVDTVIQIQTANATPDLYSFSSLNLQVVNNMTILVVFNISSSATGTNTFGANIAAANVSTTGNASGGSVSETVTNSNSSLSRILGNLSMTVTNLASVNVSQGQSNVTFLRLNFTATGETFNITEINVTRLGTLPFANSTIIIFNDSGSTANSWDVTDASIGSNNTGGNMTAVSIQVVSGTPKILFVVFNLTASQSGDLTVGAQVIGSNITAITNTSSISVTPTGATASSTVSNVQAQANLAVGTLSATSVLVTSQADGGNMSLILTIPLTNNGNATATAVNLSRTVTLLNFTNQSINGNFTITQTDVVTSIAGNGTQVNLTYNITVNSSATWDGNVNVNISVSYNDTNTQVASVNSPAASFTLVVFRVDNTDPVITRSALDTPSNNSAVNGTITVNVTITDATSGLNGTTAITRMIVANGTTTLIFNMTNSTTALTTWNSTFISTNFAEGFYNISFNATDIAGNRVLATNVVRITVDNTLPAFSDEAVNATTINPLQFTNFSISVTERTFNASSVLVSVLNFTNVTVRTIAPTCTAQGSFVFTCNMTWDGTNDTSVNVTAGTYRFRINVTDNATQFNTTNSTNTVTVSFDATAPTITSWSPAGNVANPVTTSTPSLNVTTNEAATCRFNISTSPPTYATMPYNMTGADTAHNFTLSLLDGTHSIWVNCKDAVGNTMSLGQQITFTIDTRGNFNYTQPTTGYFSAGWAIMFIPTQTILESTGKTAGTTGNFNFTSILSSLGSNWNYMYYNINGTSSGWVLATRTDPGGSTLKFVNNTNANPYTINITAANTRFTI